MPSTRSSRSSGPQDNDRLTSTLLTLNALYQTHVHPLLPETFQPMSSNISSLIMSSAPYLSQITAVLNTVLSSASSLTSGSQNSSALLSLGILLVTLYIGLRVMNYVRRTIMGWVWLGVKLVLVLVVVQVGIYVNSYGWERAISNAGWLGGIGWSLLEDALNSNQGTQQRQPRGTRQRGQNNYDNKYGQGRGGGRYGY